jgi:hypothetical protein
VRAPIPAAIVAAAVAALGAVILGEYPLEGFRPLLAGVIFGVVVGEVIATVVRTPDRFLLGTAALLTEAALVWATWISTGHDLGSAAGSAWVGIVVGAGAAPLWLRSSRRPAPSSPAEPAPAPRG